MGDLVQRFMEEMIPELQDLQQKGIFSKVEIKSIVKKRSDFEYRLRSRVPVYTDYLRYIQYEMNLELLRTKRKAKYETTKLSVSDHSSKRRISFIYERALRKFNNDVALWLQYIEFCRKSGASKKLNKIFPRALQHHPLVPLLWIRACTWEFDDNQNIENARVFAQRGLRLNPESKELWLAFFKVEIQYIEKLRQRKRLLGLMTEHAPAESNGEGDQQSSEQENISLENQAEELLDDKDRSFLSGAIPSAIFKNAIQKPALKDDYKFRLSFFKLVPTKKTVVVTAAMSMAQKTELAMFNRMCDDMAPLREIIVTSLQDFAAVEDCWDERARIAFSFELKEWKRTKKAKQQKQMEDEADLAERAKDRKNRGRSASSTKQKKGEVTEGGLKEFPEMSALRLYEEAMESCGTSKMVCLYAEFLHSRLTHYSTKGAVDLVKFFLTRLLYVMESAKAQDMLDGSACCLWAKVLLTGGMQAPALAVLEEAVSVEGGMGSCVELWLLLLHIHTQQFATISDAKTAPTRQAKFSSPRLKAQAGANKRKLAGNDELTPADSSEWKQLLEVFERAFSAVPSGSAVPIWQEYLHAHVCRTATAVNAAGDWETACRRWLRTCHAAFKRAVMAVATIPVGDAEQCSQEVEDFKLLYLDWIACTYLGSSPKVLQAKKKTKLAHGGGSGVGGDATATVAVADVVIEQLRAACAWVLTNAGVPSYAVLNKAISIESKCSVPTDMSRLRLMYEDALQKYSEQHELWLSFICAEMRAGNFERSTALYWRAVKSIPNDYQAMFVNQYQSITG